VGGSSGSGAQVSARFVLSLSLSLSLPLSLSLSLSSLESYWHCWHYWHCIMLLCGLRDLEELAVEQGSLILLFSFGLVLGGGNVSLWIVIGCRSVAWFSVGLLAANAAEAQVFRGQGVKHDHH